MNSKTVMIYCGEFHRPVIALRFHSFKVIYPVLEREGPRRGEGGCILEVKYGPWRNMYEMKNVFYYSLYLERANMKTSKQGSSDIKSFNDLYVSRHHADQKNSVKFFNRTLTPRQLYLYEIHDTAQHQNIFTETLCGNFIVASIIMRRIMRRLKIKKLLLQNRYEIQLHFRRYMITKTCLIIWPIEQQNSSGKGPQLAHPTAPPSYLSLIAEVSYAIGQFCHLSCSFPTRLELQFRTCSKL